MTSLDSLPTPALLLDLDRLDANLRWMAERAERLGVRLRPHVKTHKCVEIARRQLELGARGLTVSTLYEARVFADHGFDDLTWAFPLVPGRLDEAVELAERIDLGLVIDSSAALDALEASGRRPPAAAAYAAQGRLRLPPGGRRSAGAEVVEPGRAHRRLTARSSSAACSPTPATPTRATG